MEYHHPEVLKKTMRERGGSRFSPKNKFHKIGPSKYVLDLVPVDHLGLPRFIQSTAKARTVCHEVTWMATLYSSRVCVRIYDSCHNLAKTARSTAIYVCSVAGYHLKEITYITSDSLKFSLRLLLKNYSC